MKDSGIPWIGEVPASWRVETIGSCIKEVDNKNSDCAEDNALQFKMGTIISKKNGDSKYNPETLEAYNKVEVGDIVINGLNLSFDLISMRVGLVRERGVITSAYLAVRPLEFLSSEFLNYLFKGYDTCKAFHSMGKGLRQTLGYKELRRYSVVFPPLWEQKLIADYLDRKCGEIDELVVLQEKMIEELKSYKQSVITEAVTKGLNPNAPMKDSGIEWIGEIPEGSKMSRVGWIIYDYKAGPFGSSLITGNLLTNGSCLIYTPEHIAKLSTEVFGNLYLPEDRIEEMSQFLVKQGDIIFPIVGSLGRAMVIEKDMPTGIINQRLSRFTLNEELVNKDFFMWVFGKSSFYTPYIEMNCRGSFIVNLTKQIVCSMPFVLHPIEIQQAIADYLDEKCAEIDSLIALKQQKIEHLKEYKKSLIYEYVTGKKQVASADSNTLPSA